ncbi:hypothetical protein PoB_004787600 [Plakobranchus ocellatus]|uniref:Uncharacterized protein n=1 Tax=Plakobranchus ocellatus TaxID=259542 RepID=A0AAV4BDE1_9GAST|nr:hypothetical protein PoB_004787600 [Plakobranchus ocellatus]
MQRFDQQNIENGMEGFYLDGPLCSVAMWSCLERIKTARQACQDKELNFLISSVQTLCDLSEFGLTDKECYSRTMEAFYATYVNTFPPADTAAVQSSSDYCNSYVAKMTKTYLCADDACSYDQMVVLERFQPWASLVANASAVSFSCNMSRTCQYEQEEMMEQIEKELEEEYADYAYNYYDSEEEEEDEEYYGGGEEEEEGGYNGEEEEEEEEEEVGQGWPAEVTENGAVIDENTGENVGDVDSHVVS